MMKDYSTRHPKLQVHFIFHMNMEQPPFNLDGKFSRGGDEHTDLHFWPI